MGKKNIRLTVEEVKSMGRKRGIELTGDEAKTIMQESIDYFISRGRKHGFVIYVPSPTGEIEKRLIPIKDNRNYTLIKERMKKGAKELNCFVGHNFDEKEVKNLRLVLKEIFSLLKINPYFADEVLRDKTIREKVFVEICKTDFAVFEITKLSPNVAIEIGAALIKNKMTTFLRREGEKIPIELQGLDMIPYSTYLDLSEKLFALLPDFLEEYKLF
jgi:hypothetical protein